METRQAGFGDCSPPVRRWSPLFGTVDCLHMATAHAPLSQRMIVQVPPGAVPGMTLKVELNDGRVLRVTVPHGAAVGTKLAIDVPPTTMYAVAARAVGAGADGLGLGGMGGAIGGAMGGGGGGARSRADSGDHVRRGGGNESPYGDWSRWQLANALVRDGRVLRGERTARKDELERLMLAQFHGRADEAVKARAVDRSSPSRRRLVLHVGAPPFKETANRRRGGVTAHCGSGSPPLNHEPSPSRRAWK